MQPQQPNYDFIINHQPAPQNRLSLPGVPGGGNSLLGRLAIFGGGLVLLLILFLVFKGILSGGSNGPALIIVAQDQQAIIHVVTEAASQTAISTTNANYAATALITLNSEQSGLLTYMSTNKIKATVKQLGLKISATTDAQLTAGASANNYNQVFQQVSSGQLTDYSAALQHAYKLTKGTKGRALLTADYVNAQLLLRQLNASGSNATN